MCCFSADDKHERTCLGGGGRFDTCWSLLGREVQVAAGFGTESGGVSNFDLSSPNFKIFRVITFLLLTLREKVVNKSCREWYCRQKWFLQIFCDVHGYGDK